MSYNARVVLTVESKLAFVVFFIKSSNGTIYNRKDFKKIKLTINHCCFYLWSDHSCPSFCVFYQLTLSKWLVGWATTLGVVNQVKTGEAEDQTRYQERKQWLFPQYFLSFFPIWVFLHIKVGLRFRCRPPGLTNPAQNASSIRPCNQECAAKQVC